MATTGAAIAEAEALDEQDFRSYLRDVVPLLIGGSEGVLDNVLEDNSALLKRFIQEGSDEGSSGQPAPFVIIRNVPDAKGTRSTAHTSQHACIRCAGCPPHVLLAACLDIAVARVRAWLPDGS